MNARRRSLAAALLPVVLLAACTAGSAAPASSSATSAPSAVASASPSSGADASGSTTGSPGGTPIPINPGSPVASVGGLPPPSPSMVTPTAGLFDIRDVRASGVWAEPRGGHLIATVAWWSGPAPCSVLAEVKVDRASASDVTLTVREGAAQRGVMCPALATYKATTVDLGPLTAGSVTVHAYGVDQPFVFKPAS